MIWVGAVLVHAEVAVRRRHPLHCPVRHKESLSLQRRQTSDQREACAERNVLERGRPDRPGRAGAPDPCSDTPPPARLALAPPPYNTGVYRSTGAAPGRSRSTSDCVPIFYLTPVCECRSGGSADRLGLWPLAWSFHGAAVEHRPIRRGTQANPPWNRLAVLTRQADRKQLCRSGGQMAVADACVH
jgi:hypothetical protein